jgi:hypothetical protein
MIDFEQPTDRFCLESRRFRHPLCRAACRGAEQHLHGQNAQDRVDDGGLADTRAADDDDRLAGEARRIASRWLSASLRPLRSSTHATALAASMNGPFGVSSSRPSSRLAHNRIDSSIGSYARRCREQDAQANACIGQLFCRC